MKSLNSVLLFALVFIASCTGDEDSNKQLMERWVTAVNEVQNISIFDQFMMPDFILHTDGQPPRNLAEVKESYAELFENVNDFTVKAEDVICQGNRVVVRWSYSYTDKENGKLVVGSSVSIDRIENGRMKEAWEIVGQAAWDGNSN